MSWRDVPIPWFWLQKLIVGHYFRRELKRMRRELACTIPTPQ